MPNEKNNNSLVQKRSESERIRDEIILINFYFQNVPFTKMGDALQARTESDYRISFIEVKKVLDAAIKKWDEENLIKISARKNKELAKCDALEQEYWTAWNNSKQKRTEYSTKKERVILHAGTEVNDAGKLIPVVSESWVETEKKMREFERDGNPKFLEGIERCIHKRCLILGLYQPLRIGKTGNIKEGDLENEDYYGMPLTEVHERLLVIFQKGGANGEEEKIQEF